MLYIVSMCVYNLIHYIMIKNRKHEYTSPVEELLISVPMFCNKQLLKEIWRNKSMLEPNESTGSINLKSYLVIIYLFSLVSGNL